jgi:hypothetical protein
MEGLGSCAHSLGHNRLHPVSLTKMLVFHFVIQVSVKNLCSVALNGYSYLLLYMLKVSGHG